MYSPLVWLVAAGPLAIASVGGTRPLELGRGKAVNLACGANLCVALVAIAIVAMRGSLRTGTTGFHGIGFGLYLDSLSAAMFALVSFIGLVVVAYSRHYMAGDPRHHEFTRGLCVTLVSVLFLSISGNLFQFALAWLAVSRGLNKLLLFYSERRAAVLGGRKQWIAGLLSHASLLVAAIATYHLYGSLDYRTIFTGAGALHIGNVPPVAHVAAVSLAIAALLMSAQFPMHGWLMEVMETPTPVSALLHAGIINAGGFLLLRFSTLVSLSLPSLEVLVLVGGFTALFGSVVMLTQTSIKVTLATSTIAQMGFMILECGLGAFPAALLHIIAHSLYKAHAFLASGSVFDIARSSWSPSPGGQPHPARQLLAVVAVLTIGFAAGRTFGLAPAEQPGIFVLGAVLLLSLIHLVSSGIDERPSVYVVGRTALYAVGVACAYFYLQVVMIWLFSDAVSDVAALRGPFAESVEVAVVSAFAVVTLLQGRVPGDGGSPRWQTLYALVWNGLYVNTFMNRVLMRIWPPNAASRQ